MATITITGNGHNSAVTLYKIHQGNCSFKKDTATFHSQVKLMQEALTSIGYNTQGANGKFGSNTLAAVKAFQKAKGLTADGYFGKNSLNALEDEIGRHLDPDNCGNQETGGDTGGGSSLSVSEYLNNLESFCNCGWKYGAGYDASAKKIDCAYYPFKARNGLGAHGCTTEYNYCLSQKGTIASLGGYDVLEVGMEIFQQDTNEPTKKGHMGVYAGKHTLLLKHHETFWVKAVSENRDGREWFRYDKILHTKNPNTSLLAPLLEADKITVDLAAHYKPDGKWRDHGMLFKMLPNDLPLLLGEPIEYDLTCP